MHSQRGRVLKCDEGRVQLHAADPGALSGAGQAEVRERVALVLAALAGAGVGAGASELLVVLQVARGAQARQGQAGAHGLKNCASLYRIG